MQPLTYRVSPLWLVVTAIFWVILAFLLPFTIVVPVIAVIVIVRALALYASTRVVLDDNGITLRQGFITTREMRLPVGKINAIATSVGPVGAILNYGSIALTVGNDENRIKIANLGGCLHLKDQLDRLVAD